VDLLDLVDFSLADLPSLEIKAKYGNVNWEYKDTPYEWRFGSHESFSLETSTDFLSVWYIGFNHDSARVINALGDSEESAQVIKIDKPGFESIRVGSILAIDYDKLPNLYMMYYIS